MKLFVGIVCGSVAVEASKKHFPKKFSWDTLPVVWHGSVDDTWTDETVQALSKYAAVTLEKNAGGKNVYPWAKNGSMLTCQKDFDLSGCGCCQEDMFEKNFNKLKAAAPHVMTIAYVNSIIAYPWYNAAHLNAANKSLPLRLEDGSFAHNINVNLARDETWFAWNFGIEEVRTIFKEQCSGMTSKGVDGCYIDGCQNVPGPLDSETKAAYIAGKQQALEELQQEVPGMLLCGSGGDTREGMYGTSIQNWNKHTDQLATREIPSLMKAVSEGAMYEAKGKMVCSSGIDGDPNNADLQTELAAFLVAAGEYSYYRCGGWSHADAPWYPVYDKKLGAPLSNATLGDDGIWRRSFAAGTDVTFNTNTNVGTIQWGEDKVVSV